MANAPIRIFDSEFSLITYNPPNRGAPGKTGDAATRGECPGIIALQPSLSNWGETTYTHPTFWIYLSDADQSVTLSISEEYSQKPFYSTRFISASEAGIGRYTLPYTAPSLAIDTPYRWRMDVSCPTENEAPAPSVEGVVMRRAIPTALQAELNEAAPRDRIVLLSADGLWYDALDELAELRLANGVDETLEADWENLLQHVEPLVKMEGGLSATIVGQYPEILPDLVEE
ncbi:MAG: DUF928 domain-containing protein [Cyanobacteria bacterium J06649_4]